MRVVARRRRGLHARGRDRQRPHARDRRARRPGGADLGPSPTRAAAAALAACTAITCEMYADRKGWELGAVEVEVEIAQGRGSVFERDHGDLAGARAARRAAARAAAGDRRQVPRAPGALGRDRGRRSTIGSKRSDGPRAWRDAPARSPAPAAGSASRPRAELCAEGASVLLIARGAEELAEAAGGVSRGGDRGRRGRRAGARRHRRRTPASGSSPRRRAASASSTCSSTTPAPRAGATSTRSPRPTGRRPGS